MVPGRKKRGEKKTVEFRRSWLAWRGERGRRKKKEKGAEMGVCVCVDAAKGIAAKQLM